MPKDPWRTRIEWAQELQPVETTRKRGAWCLSRILVDLSDQGQPVSWQTELRQVDGDTVAAVSEPPQGAPEMLDGWLASAAYLRAVRSRLAWRAKSLVREWSNDGAGQELELALAAWSIDDRDQRATAIKLATGGWAGRPDDLADAVAGIHT